MIALKIDKKNLKESWRFVVSKITCWILIWAPKSLKNLHFDWSIPVIFDLKKYGGILFLDTREWFKIWRKTNLWFGKYMRNLANFYQSNWKSQNWDFDGILLSKVENVWAENLQGSYVSWQSRLMQKSKKNWLVNSKLTWGIWQSLTRALENLKYLHFNCLPLTKVYNVWAKKVQGSYVWWHFCFQKREEEFGKVLPEHLKVSKLGLWWYSFS